MSSQPAIPGGRFGTILGRGGTAEVALWTNDKSRSFACKYPLSQAPSDTELFAALARREWHLGGTWHFPGVVRIHMHGECFQYLLMDICHGPSLDSVGHIPFSAALEIFSSIAASLAVIHARGILHCDIKPHNIFLSRDWNERLPGDRNFITKFSDFSLGKYLAEPESCRIGIGTMGYAAPETIRSGVTSVQSDLFSLGVVGWQLFAGKHPFIDSASHVDPVRTGSRVAEEVPEQLTQIIDNCPDALSSVVASLLAKAPSDRPVSAWDVCRILSSLLPATRNLPKIKPRYVFDRIKTSQQIIDSLAISVESKHWLQDISTDSSHRLLAILDANARNGTLAFDGSTFCSSARPLWPQRFRNNALQTIVTSTMSQKKMLIRDAIALAGNAPHHASHCLPHGRDAHLLLLPLLRNATIKRVAKHSVREASRSKHFVSAAYFSVMAGMLDSAIQNAEMAARQLLEEHDHERVLAVVRHVIRYAELCDRLFECRQLLMIEGDALKASGKADEALSVYYRIVSLYDNDEPDHILAECYKDIGDICKMRQTFQDGIEALNKALLIYQSLNDEVEISHVLNNLGNIFWIKLDLKRAARHYRDALRIQRRLNAVKNIASTLNNLGSTQVMAGKYRRGIIFYSRSLSLSKDCDDLQEAARTLNNLGYTYHVMGQPLKSVESLRESLAINRRIGSKKEILFNLENLTQVMIGAGQLHDAVPLLGEGTSLALELGDMTHHATFLLSRSLVARRMGDFTTSRSALDEARKSSEHSDSAILKSAFCLAEASYCLAIGGRNKAAALAHDALSAADASGDKSSKLNALLLLTRLTGESHYRESGRHLAHELGLTREQRLLNSFWLEAQLESGLSPHVDESALRDDALAFIDDIERPAVLLTAARILASLDNQKEAEELASAACTKAIEINLLPEHALAQSVLASLQSHRGDFESAYRNVRSSLNACKLLSESIADASERNGFLSQGLVQSLFAEVKRLADALGNKKGQVVA